ncbi:MAG: lysoplasmalogenase [Bacteroidales bacterium]|nr:lysoplasmalogenase [Bacteroidales bacterium]
MKSTLWRIPALFFVAAAVTNLLGHTSLAPDSISELVKPALLPLLALTTLAAAGTTDIKGLKTILLAQLFGCTGDILLIPDGFLPFVCGMLAFLLGHVCYMSVFGGRSWKGLKLSTWIIALIVMAGAVAGLVAAIGIKGAMLAPMAVYGMALMMLIFSALMGVVRIGGRAWWIILCGAVLFTFSDALIATGSFGVLPFTGKRFVIMLTYLAAQSLLAAGFLRLKE